MSRFRIANHESPFCSSCHHRETRGWNRPRQRLQPGGIIVIVMTRWSTKDLVGKVLKRQGEEHADQWEVVEFPAIMPESDEPLWPEFWSLEELHALRSELPASKWNAQYQQSPTSEQGDGPRKSE